MIQRFQLGAEMPRSLAEHDVSVQAVLRRAGLPLGVFEQERVLLSTEELIAFWAAITEVSGDAGIGLALGTENRIERYSPLSIAMLYAPSFHCALQKAARYKRLTCPEEIVLTRADGNFDVRFDWSLAAVGVPDVLVDYCFAWVLTIGRRGTGLPLVPVRVELRRPERQRARLERYFGCEIVFDCAADTLVFHGDDVARPFGTHNAALLAVVAPHLEAELRDHFGSRALPGQVKGALKRLLAGDKPDLADVARELRVSPRTLQRRIAEHKQTYQQLLEEARRELAVHYLRDRKLGLGEVAFLLGYADTSSFFRAFRTWEGTSPGRWRSDEDARVGAG